MNVNEAKAILASATFRPMTKVERSTYFVEPWESCKIGDAPGGWFIITTLGLGAQLQNDEGDCWIYDEVGGEVYEG